MYTFLGLGIGMASSCLLSYIFHIYCKCLIQIILYNRGIAEWIGSSILSFARGIRLLVHGSSIPTKSIAMPLAPTLPLIPDHQ